MRVEAQGKTSVEQNNPGLNVFFLSSREKSPLMSARKFSSSSRNNSLYFDASIRHWFENTGESVANLSR